MTLIYNEKKIKDSDIINLYKENIAINYEDRDIVYSNDYGILKYYKHKDNIGKLEYNGDSKLYKAINEDLKKIKKLEETITNNEGIQLKLTTEIGNHQILKDKHSKLQQEYNELKEKYAEEKNKNYDLSEELKKMGKIESENKNLEKKLEKYKDYNSVKSKVKKQKKNLKK